MNNGYIQLHANDPITGAADVPLTEDGVEVGIAKYTHHAAGIYYYDLIFLKDPMGMIEARRAIAESFPGHRTDFKIVDLPTAADEPTIVAAKEPE